ncbi:protein translocase subunit SecD [Corynebacterium sp. ES2794-CONJ1]|uniref:protein translocase subunit SecD n=1 Tax=unclassified Corynebacterium TaxID=2624378 RepID=UPI00216912DE|nr:MULTISPECIES: protein translocase subunit SecD [unclassified Corynebacterium]MCS4489227.1 protein translocase subunit SecD [Corynebacterium sp. ES2775-CONJ]MCS4491040.1 protein translocase subunit SecD [Corynebacterium sp. ES2715-CONJ3]MCS4531079.1 protein translocase subunit SecD [Corynebacterium sp. ES2730-CONJ]MCU9518446.1 protein translocase subunit SecD [Corynebacterium sp. ES2794-CONJ1]
MASTTRSGGSRWEQWPKRAIAGFITLLVLVYALIFFTGDRSASPKLGIDLQGGTRVTLVPQGSDPTQDQLAQARTILENRVNGMGVSGASVIIDGSTLVITVPGEDTSQARAVGQTSQLLFRPVANPGDFDTSKLIPVVQDMANRWVEAGVASPDQLNEKLEKISSFAANEESSKDNAEQKDAADISTITVTAKAPQAPQNSIESAARREKILEVMHEDRQSSDPLRQFAAATLLICDDNPDLLQGSDDPAKPLVACDPGSADSEEDSQVYILDPAPLLVGETEGPQAKRLTGEEIDTARPITGGLNSQTGQMEISFAFKSDGGSEGSATWAKLTQDYLKRNVAITLDSKVISAPVIQSPTPIGSATSITGKFTNKEAQDLANNLRYGALPLSFAGENGEQGGTAITVPASLGVASLKAGLIAGLVGLILVALFSLYFYRFFGVISLVSLIMSGLFVYGSLVLLGRLIGYSLDLAGIAGLIIGIGTTADSFVVIYERIKDEIRNGRTFRSAVPHAWDRAKNTIITGNFVTIIAAVVVYLLAVGEVKGFAFTLGLTTVFDLLITFLFTAPLVILASRRPWTAQPAANGLGRVFDYVARNNISAPLDTAAPEMATAAQPQAPTSNEEK